MNNIYSRTPFAFFIALFFLFVPGRGYTQSVPAAKPTRPAVRNSAASTAAPRLSHAQEAALLRHKIKYLFVIYQENRSFDSYFGTFPGANGLFSHPAAQTPGFYEPLTDTSGSTITIHPFRIGPEQFAADTDDTDHSHPMIVAKMDIVSGTPRMDRFAMSEEHKRVKPGQNPSLAAKQMGELAMSYEDCDTVPLLWRYAQRFVLFDHIFQEMTGPSTLGNLAIIAAQTGQTQWALHPDEAYKGNGARAAGMPVVNDSDPFWGSQLDPTQQDEKMPVAPNEREREPQLNLTFASLPLTLLGGDAESVTKLDRDPSKDLADVRNDVAYIPKHNPATIPFGWFQEGYDAESSPTEPPDKDDDPVDANGLHASYITHHNGPQYFGYIANNPKMREEMHGMADFFRALDSHSLPSQGGMFFVKGGRTNIFHLKPSDPDSAVQKRFNGDDDHPAYSDSQISEALVAEAVNKIAASPYWAQSAIIITWDDSEGAYDHVPPPVYSYGPDGSPISDGPRVPFILISPYARTGYVAHASGNQASVVKFADLLFNRTPLALLPDERRARALGEKEFHQKNLGPEDALTPNVTDLIDAFSVERLLGKTPPLSSDYAEIPESLVLHLPAETNYGCAALKIVPVDRARHISNAIPSDFNPRPLTDPTAP
ncbi:MAG TPA: alkaline phosphatase family protein [Candidatus Acidoferrales bacterium]|nr:alkaline phosphatase family protein [Candidatus Acidoferrales bacterium]